MDKIQLLKKLLPGFLPLLVFILADEFFKTEVALLIAIAFGILELIYTYHKEKRIDKFIIFDTLLLVALGALSILLQNKIFFKLKPALIELIFCIILGISVFSKTNIIMLMSQRYMKNIKIDKAYEKKLTNSLKILFFIFVFHTALIIYSAYALSDKAWAFISGGLFYIIFALYFVYELIINKIKQRKYVNEEWLPIIDDDGNVVGKAPRSVCHEKPGMLHPVIHLHVVNNKGEIFLQKRGLNKLVQPGKWDTAVGGHLAFNETIEEGLKRETLEEIGIENYTPQFVMKYRLDSEIESEVIFTFITQYDGKIQINKDEIEDGKFWTIKEIKKNLGKNTFTPNFEQEFEAMKEIFEGK